MFNAQAEINAELNYLRELRVSMNSLGMGCADNVMDTIDAIEKSVNDITETYCKEQNKMKNNETTARPWGNIAVENGTLIVYERTEEPSSKNEIQESGRRIATYEDMGNMLKCVNAYDDLVADRNRIIKESNDAFKDYAKVISGLEAKADMFDELVDVAEYLLNNGNGEYRNARNLEQYYKKYPDTQLGRCSMAVKQAKELI